MKIKYVFEMGDDREVTYYNSVLKGKAPIFIEHKKLSNDKVRTVLGMVLEFLILKEETIWSA